MSIIFALTIFCFCFYAVFSRRFHDGIIAKHLFIFAAITAMLKILDPYNCTALAFSTVFALAGLSWWRWRMGKLWPKLYQGPERRMRGHH